MSLKFSADHLWIFIEGQIATIGLTALAQKEIGEIVYIELPQVGAALEEGKEVVVLESTKAAIDLYSPLKGAVTAVNEALRQDPSLINRSPQKRGWLFQMQLFALEDADSLLSSEQYDMLVSSPDPSL